MALVHAVKCPDETPRSQISLVFPFNIPVGIINSYCYMVQHCIFAGICLSRPLVFVPIFMKTTF